MAERPRRPSLTWRLAYAFSDLHVRLYRPTRGRVGGTYRRAPVLLLDHIGQKTGKNRTHPVLYLWHGGG